MTSLAFSANSEVHMCDFIIPTTVEQKDIHISIWINNCHFTSLVYNISSIIQPSSNLICDQNQWLMTKHDPVSL